MSENLLVVKIGNVKVDESQMVFFNDYPTSIDDQVLPFLKGRELSLYPCMA